MHARIASGNQSSRQEISESQTRLRIASKDFLITQTSIVASVAIEPGSIHRIDRRCLPFINANNDTWSNESLRHCYDTFIGAYNYINHVQVHEKAVGFIADAALRRIYPDPEDKSLFIYYVDILVATSREHNQLCQSIINDEIQWLSMGCSASVTICSVCGHQSHDESDVCNHILLSKGKIITDDAGDRVKVAEILGDGKSADGCIFVEASWLTQVPAFGGAKKRNILPIGSDQMIDIVMPTIFANRPAVTRYV